MTMNFSSKASVEAEHVMGEPGTQQVTQLANDRELELPASSNSDLITETTRSLIFVYAAKGDCTRRIYCMTGLARLVKWSAASKPVDNTVPIIGIQGKTVISEPKSFLLLGRHACVIRSKYSRAYGESSKRV